MSWYSVEKSLEDYEANLSTRMKAEGLDEAPLVNLMLRCDGADTPDAYLAPVFINRLRRSLGGTSFILLFVDQDLRPTGEPAGSIMTTDNMWRPLNTLGIEGKDFSIRTGYFLPYEQGPFGDTFVEIEEIPLARTF